MIYQKSFLWSVIYNNLKSTAIFSELFKYKPRWQATIANYSQTEPERPTWSLEAPFFPSTRLSDCHELSERLKLKQFDQCIHYSLLWYVTGSRLTTYYTCPWRPCGSFGQVQRTTAFIVRFLIFLCRKITLAVFCNQPQALPILLAQKSANIAKIANSASPVVICVACQHKDAAHSDQSGTNDKCGNANIWEPRSWNLLSAGKLWVSK